MKSLFLSITILAMVSTCKKNTQTTEITKIEFGTSFGSCIGYCTKIMTLENGDASKKFISRDKNKLQKICNDFTDTKSIFKKVDLSLFNQLEETIGCPDCADGGAEWIEIFTVKSSKKVTYEHDKEPKEVKAFISDLRKQFDELGECD